MSDIIKPYKLQYSICVSGAAGGDSVELSSELAERLGTAIAKHGHVLTTGATVGLPFYAARGAKAAGGVSIGFSPASSVREHMRKYRLPYEPFDFINYTGMNYVGRDLYLVQSSDAVITVGGRFGSLHEFTSALESNMPVGVLLDSGGTADVIQELIALLDPSKKNLVMFDDNPERLVETIVRALDEDYKDIKKQLEKNELWFLNSQTTKHAG